MTSTEKLLIAESPLMVLPSLVKMIGLERAIILQQIYYAEQQPNSGKVLTDGKKYIWNTYTEWKESYFPFWSEKSIQRHFLLLEKEGFILSAQPLLSTGDATKFYRVNVDKLLLDIQQQGMVQHIRPCPSSNALDHPIQQVRPSPSNALDHLYKGTKTSTKTSTKKKNISETSSDVVKKISVQKSSDSAELTIFRRTLSDFQNNYAAPTGKGAAIAQNNAIRNLFDLSKGDAAICVEIHRLLQREEWRKMRVKWTDVEKEFPFHKARTKAESTNHSSVSLPKASIEQLEADSLAELKSHKGANTNV